MIRIILSAALAAGLFSATPALAQHPRPEIGEPRPFSVPQTRTIRLGNGLEATFIPFGLAPKTTISVRVRAGNVDDGTDTWLADLTGAMMEQGAAGRSNEAIARAAAAMGGGLSVNVGLHETGFTTSVLSEYGPDALALIADVVQRPDFPESELSRVRQNLTRNVTVARSQPGPVASEAYAALLFGTGHPYGRPLPTAEELAGYTLDDIRGFYAANFGAARTRIYIAGRFDMAQMEAAVRAAFAGWSAGPADSARPAAPQPGPVVRLIDRPGAPQTTIRLGFPAVGPAHRDAIPLAVTNALLGGAFTSRLTRNLREDKGWTYSPFSSVTSVLDGGYWTFNADITTAATAPALAETFGEITRLQIQVPPAEEATAMRTWLSGVFVLRNASPAGLIGEMSFRDLHRLPADYLDTYVPRVLAVTDAGISAVANTYMPLDRMVLVVVGDLDVIADEVLALPQLAGARVIRPEAEDGQEVQGD